MCAVLFFIALYAALRWVRIVLCYIFPGNGEKLFANINYRFIFIYTSITKHLL